MSGLSQKEIGIDSRNREIASLHLFSKDRLTSIWLFKNYHFNKYLLTIISQFVTECMKEQLNESCELDVQEHSLSLLTQEGLTWTSANRHR